MIPDYILDEINHRLRAADLHRSKAKAICRTLGIDHEVALQTATTIDDTVAELRELARTDAVHEGAVWFQFATDAEGSTHRVHGRIVFVTTPYGIDGTQGHMVSACEALVWREGEPTPTWQPIPEEMLPLDLVNAAFEEIDELATAKSRAMN